MNKKSLTTKKTSLPKGKRERERERERKAKREREREREKERERLLDGGCEAGCSRRFVEG